jgi:hypothetical protein
VVLAVPVVGQNLDDAAVGLLAVLQLALPAHSLVEAARA